MEEPPICDELQLLANFGDTAADFLQLVLAESAFQVLLGTDFPALARAAHIATGVCRSLYLPALTQTTQKLETALKCCDRVQLEKDWNQFQNYVREFNTSYQLLGLERTLISQND